MSNLSIKTAFNIHEIDPLSWDALSNLRPFQSHRWYAYGERVMGDCQPIYVLAYDSHELIGRASFWLVRTEPLPKMVGLFRRPAMAMLKRWPLLVCRSPLSFSSGLIISNDNRRETILSAFTEAALTIARQYGISFILFDYLGKSESQGWPDRFSTMSTVNPGMQMENCWASMDQYMVSVGKKDRQHYKRVVREAGKMDIRINCHSRAERIDDALPLIRNVEINHGAIPNPWAAAMLENMEMVNGAFLTATIHEQLVGCGLLLEDNNSQMTSILGLAEDTPYVYFMLVYESLRMALEHKIHLLRWGSGAYDVKRRLGFSFEDNASLVFTAVNPAIQKMLSWTS